MIRAGEKFLQRSFSRKPIVMACISNRWDYVNAFNNLTIDYIYCFIIGFPVSGIRLGLYATPSTDTAIDNVPEAKAGEAAGIYKNV